MVDNGYSQHQMNMDLLELCEKYCNILDIPYFTMISNIYEPYKNGNMTEFNNGFIQEIYEKGIFEADYRNAFINMTRVDKQIKEWVVPVCWSGNVGDSSIDCLDIYKEFDLTDPMVCYLKVYNVYRNDTQSELYVISSHSRDDGSNKLYGHKINISDSCIGENKIYVLKDLWLTGAENTIKDVNTHFANDYIINFFSNKKIPQTKFNLGEEFFISRLVEDFKAIINDSNLDMTKLRIDDLLKEIRSECINRG